MHSQPLEEPDLHSQHAARLSSPLELAIRVVPRSRTQGESDSIDISPLFLTGFLRRGLDQVHLASA